VLEMLAAPGDRMVVDLVRIPDAEARRSSGGYQGLGW
jgi:GDP-mannose 6-dehydrogenase